MCRSKNTPPCEAATEVWAQLPQNFPRAQLLSLNIAPLQSIFKFRYQNNKNQNCKCMKYLFDKIDVIENVCETHHHHICFVCDIDFNYFNITWNYTGLNYPQRMRLNKRRPHVNYSVCILKFSTPCNFILEPDSAFIFLSCQVDIDIWY